MIGTGTAFQHQKHVKRGQQQQQKDIAKNTIAPITHLGCRTTRLFHDCPHILCALRVCFCEDCVCLHSVLLAEAQQSLARDPLRAICYLQKVHLLCSCILHGIGQSVSACDATASTLASWSYADRMHRQQIVHRRLFCRTHQLSLSLDLADQQVVTLGYQPTAALISWFIGQWQLPKRLLEQAGT